MFKNRVRSFSEKRVHGIDSFTLPKIIKKNIVRPKEEQEENDELDQPIK